MKILVETSGGGGIVLVVVLALVASHGGGISAALLIVVIVLAVVAAAAAAGTVAVVVHRGRQEVRPAPSLAPRPVLRAEVLGDPHPAIEPVRLHPEQLAELAEILRRDQRPEQ
jgi:hypothetical protein